MARCVGIGTQQSVVELEPTVASVALFYAATAYINNNNNNTLIYIAPACRMTSEALADSSSRATESNCR